MKQRDLDLLSSYLDGQLKPSDSARLERRLASDSDLRAVLDDLRSARGLLRQLPMRKAPRNFTLTPRMVGKNPPLPRTYPTFKFVTALASLLLFFSMGLNFMAVQMSAPGSTAFGMGGGGAPEVYSAEAPAAAESAATEVPAEEPSVQLAPPTTATASVAEDSARAADRMEKNAISTQADGYVNPAAQTVPQPVPPVWQIVLAGVALLGALTMILMRRLAVERWRGK
jgi:anti-sigma factor RsiW